MATKNNRPSVDVIIPTYDNFNQLTQCVYSIVAHASWYPVNIIIVNNGKVKLGNELGEIPNIRIINCDENLGWTGGLQEGLKHSSSKYVLFANDDIYIPPASCRWLKSLVREMDIYPNIGAIGPSSNIVMGLQNIWYGLPRVAYLTEFLIGFCMLVRREALDKAGGIRDMEYGGDDLDLSMRIRKAGYMLVVKRDVFVYHHGFQTGVKIHGDSSKPNGWNSREMMDNTNMELIRKHGFVEFRKTISNNIDEEQMVKLVPLQFIENETLAIKKYVNGGITLEVGCGGKKTVPHAIGIDIIPKGEEIPYMDIKSVADIAADVTTEIPLPDEYADCIIARHVLEHCLDTVKTLKEWKRLLKSGGRLVIACPDERVCEGIPVNPEHVHAFTADSCESLGDAIGFKTIGKEQDYNGISFTVCMEKIQ